MWPQSRSRSAMAIPMRPAPIKPIDDKKEA
jgi:hypothetical protein